MTEKSASLQFVSWATAKPQELQREAVRELLETPELSWA